MTSFSDRYLSAIFFCVRRNKKKKNVINTVTFSIWKFWNYRFEKYSLSFS